MPRDYTKHPSINVRSAAVFARLAKPILTIAPAAFLDTQSMELVSKTVLSTTLLLLESVKLATPNVMVALTHALTASIVLLVSTNVDLFASRLAILINSLILPATLALPAMQNAKLAQASNSVPLVQILKPFQLTAFVMIAHIHATPVVQDLQFV